MHRAGVRFLAGTDIFGLVPGFALHDELASFVQVGLSPLEALRTATINPAQFFAREKDLGTIRPGRLADLVLLGPLEAGDEQRHVSPGRRHQSHGRRFTPLMNADTSRSGSPVISSPGSSRKISSNMNWISRRARFAPRQKCGPPAP